VNAARKEFRMRAITILILPSLTALALMIGAPARAQSTEEVVSRGVVNERDRGEPLIAVPQSMQADIENRSPSNFTIIVDPMRTGADAQSSRDEPRRGPQHSPRDFSRPAR
jgi:hypothetical protein